MDENEPQSVELETPAQDMFIAPSIHEQDILGGESYTHHSKIPEILSKHMSTECCLGIDEAGRGPVLGEMSITSSKSDLLTFIRSYGIWIVLSANIPASPLTSQDASLRRFESSYSQRTVLSDAEVM